MTQRLRASRPGELLIFYFGSHGGYNAKQQAYWFAAYDDEWVFDTIEREFKGAEALLFADCCHSGALAELLPQRHTPLVYATLSSTYAHNTAWSRWRFVDCLIRAFRGDPRVDWDRDGQVDLDELARFTERHMAFVAEGRPMFATTNGFNPRLCFANVTQSLSDPQVGQYVEAHWKDQWHKAEILDVKDGQYKIHDTDYGAKSDEWVTPDRARRFCSWSAWPCASRSSCAKPCLARRC